MAEPHSQMRLGEYRRRAQPAVQDATWRDRHGPKSVRRLHIPTLWQLDDDRPDTLTRHPVKLTNRSGRSQQADLQVAGHFTPCWLPDRLPADGSGFSPSWRRSNGNFSVAAGAAHWSTDIIGGGLLATSLLALATASRWSRGSHGRLRNDQGGKR